MIKRYPETPFFDQAAFGANIHKAMRDRSVSYRQLETITRIPHKTIYLIAGNRTKCNVENYMRLMKWMENVGPAQLAPLPYGQATRSNVLCQRASRLACFGASKLAFDE